MKAIRNVWYSTLLFALAGTAALAQNNYWTGTGATMNWSDSGNWALGAPNSLQTLWFEDQLYAGFTNAPGLVNNVVDGNVVVGNISANAFAVTNTFTGLPSHYYNTWIPTGVGLGVAGIAGQPAVRIGYDTPTYANGTVVCTVSGAGSLFITNNQATVNIAQGANSSGTHKATLDLSGLSSLTMNLSNLWLGASSYFDKSAGAILLATNTTITTSPNLGAPGILLGRGMTNNGFGAITLGAAATTFNTDGLVVGGARASLGANLISFIPPAFGAAPTATFTLRGSAGDPSATAVFAIGDSSATETNYSAIANGTGTGGSSTSPSMADFSAGIVDVLATNIFVGRSAADGAASGTSAGTAFGNLTFANGTIDAMSVAVAFKQGTNKSLAAGSILAKGSAVLNVSNDLILSYVTNTTVVTASSMTAGLNVNDSAVVNVNGNITNRGGVSTIGLLGGTINMTGGGYVQANSLQGIGSVTGSSLITVSNISPGITNSGAIRPGTLTLAGNLVLNGTSGTKFKIGATTTPGSGISDYLDIGNNLTVNNTNLDLFFAGLPAVGTYDLIHYAGTKSGSFNLNYTNTTRNTTFALDQSQPNHVYLNVGGGPPASLTWAGGGNGIWDLTNNVNWNNNSQKFFTLDNVLFNDTGVQPIISVSGTVAPGSITFNNNSRTYTLFGGSSTKITGPTGITKNGTGTIIWDDTANNDFTGPININQGKIQLETASSSSTYFGATNKLITVASGATLDLYGNSLGSSSSGIGWPITFSGTGIGGIGAIAHTKASSGPTLTTPKATLADDALIGVTTSGLNLFIGGAAAFPLGGSVDLGGHTLTASGLGNIGFVNMIITNSGTIQVNCPNLTVRDCALDGAGTVIVGGKNLVLGNLSGTSWTTGYVAKAISIGPGSILAVGNGAITIPVASPVSLSGALLISNAQPISLSGIVSGGYNVTKLGAAKLTLSGANAYSGSTIVSGGTLALGSTGSIASSPLVRIDSAGTLDVTAQSGSYSVPVGQNVQVDGSAIGNFTVPAGATLSGSGICSGMVTVNGGNLIPGKLDLPRTLNVGNLSLNGAAMTYELDAVTTSGGSVNDLVAAGQLAFTGTTTIKIVPIGTLNTTQPYTLFTYTGAPLPSSITNNLVLTSDTRYSFSFVDPASTPGMIQITVSGGRSGLVWQGGVSGAETAWNINTTSNWNNGGTPDFFFNGDSVVFDDTAVTNRADMVGSLRPATIDLANNSLPFVFAGTGGLRTGAITNEGTAGLTIANSSDNTLSGAGLFLSAGTVTFNQPTNSHFTAILNSSSQGTIVKEGTNLLTMTGNSASTFSSPIQVNNGTLQAGSTNPFGYGTITVTNSATLDIGGQVLDAPNVAVSGTGVGGAGAINNSGNVQTNALDRVVLNDNTTFGATNRWDIFPATDAYLQGNNFSLTKVGPGDIYIGPGHDTQLGDIDIQQGRLVFAWNGTDIGNVTNLITVRSNTTLAFAYDIAAGAKPATILPGGDIEAYVTGSPLVGTHNSYAGDLTFSTTGMVRVANLAGLNLSGSVHGPSGLVNADRGTLTLSGSNDYSGDVTVNLGQLNVASSNALPANSSVTLNCTGIPSSDGVWLGLLNDTVTPSTVPLNMITYRSPSGQLTPTLTGEGTWLGAINMIAAQTDPSQNPQISFSASSNLTIGGSVTQSGTPNVTINMLGFPGTVRFQSPLHFNGLMIMGSQGLGIDDLSQKYTTLELDSPINTFTNMNFWRGKIIIGADNALPIGCAMTIPAIRTDNDARNILDLHGHVQTIANFPGAAGFAGSGAAPLWIGNDSTNTDSTLTFSSAITNTWYAWIVDNIDTNITAVRKTGLTVTSGYLRLANLIWGNWTYGGPAGATNNVYSGPTIVTGGGFQVDAPVSNTTVTVSGGTLAGTGPFGGPIVIGSGGRLSPGGTAAFVSAIGRMTCSNSLTLQAGSQCYLEVNLTTKTNDAVVGLTSLTYGGTLIITNVGALAFTNGTIVKLFDAASYIPGAVTIVPPAPAPGLMWDASHLAVDGTLHVVTSVSPLLTSPMRLTDGNVSFGINGTVGQGYTVRASTDIALPFSNWTILQSGSIPAVPYIFSDLTATNFNSRFYRISSP